MSNPNLLDIARRLDPNGSIAAVAEVLTKKNPIVGDMPMVEGNLPIGHKSTIRTGIPTPTWRMLYQGVAPTKSSTTQVVDSCGMLEARCEIDKDLADLNGLKSEFLMTEADAFLEGMARSAATAFFYGTEGSPEQIIGLTPRFNAASNDWSKSGYNIIDGGATSGQTDLISFWLVQWGANSVFGIYPKGTRAGLEMTQPTQVDGTDGSGNHFDAYRITFKQKLGLAVRDWRKVVRIANIDESDLIAGSGTMASQAIIKKMIRASERLDTTDGAVFYVPRSAATALRIAILDKVAYNLTFETVAGQRVMMFDGIPVKVCDALVNTESAVTGTFSSI